MTIGIFLSCNKNVQDNRIDEGLVKTKINTETTVTPKELYYKNESSTYNTINYTQLHNLYYNTGVFDTTGNVLVDAAIVNGFDDDNYPVVALKTLWVSYDSTYYSISSRIHLYADPSLGITLNVLADDGTSTTTSTCVCKGKCNYGCEVMFPGSATSCSCTSCFPSGDCDKTHTVITVTTPNLM